MQTDPARPGLRIPVESGATRCVVLHGDGTRTTLDDLSAISESIARPDEIVWLDLYKPTPRDLAILQEEFDIHPMAIEDARLKHERPKIDNYEDFTSIVVHNVDLDQADDLIVGEIAIFCGNDYVVTVHSHAGLPIEEIERRWTAERDTLPAVSASLLYLILDVLVDRYAPVCDSYDDAIYKLERTVFDDRDPQGTLRDVLAMKRELQRFRRSVVPLRDMLVRYTRADGTGTVPPELFVYFRNVLDHTRSVVEQIDAARFQLRGALDVHFAWQTQRQNDVLKQLTIIATIFLPLGYMVGFFGQNFEWMTDNIKGLDHFLLFGVLPQALAVLGLFVWFYKKRFI